MLPVRTPADPWPIRLVEVGAALLALAACASLLGSPDRYASAPWAALVLLGALGVEWIVCSRRTTRTLRLRESRGSGRGHLPSRLRRPLPDSLATVRWALVLGYVCLVALPLLTRWPTAKLPGLGGLYGAIPSLLPWAPDWLAPGLSPNQTAGVLSACAAMAASLWVPMGEGRIDPRLRSLRRLAAPLAAAGLALVMVSGSRAALAALLVATLGVVVTLHRRVRRYVLATALAAAATMAAYPPLPSALLRQILRDEPLETKLLARVDIWSSALKGIADHPFAGIGLGALNDVLPVRYPYGVVGLDYTVTQAHNVVLDTALSMGLVGATGLIVALAGAAGLGFARNANVCPSDHRAIGSRAFTALLVCYSVFGLTDALSFGSPAGLVFWCGLAGLLWTSSAPHVQAHNRPTGQAPTPPPPGAPTTPGAYPWR